GAGALIIWLLIPVFVIGLLFYLIAVGAVSMAYVMHRNARVSYVEQVLTAEHIKGLFAGRGKKMKVGAKGMSFITANGNDVPLPEAKSAESFGFSTACEIFEDAIWRRTSDILLVPGASEYTISYVIDGLSTKQEPRDREDVDYFIHYLKQIADLDPNEKRKPQRGMMEVKIAESKTKWEINTAGSTAGEQMRIRHYEESDMMKLDDIGLDKDQLESLKTVRDITSGLFITSGPPKSGVTASFYAMLKNHDPFMNDMNTLEKSPTGTLDNITQNTYSLSDTGTSSYANYLQTIVRMGANIIGVADVDEAETAKVATAAAAANRMVHVNIHAQSVLKAIVAWIKLSGDKNAVMSNLKGVINQRI
ncbi:MAG: Flp pilus assembly complex ATPase component TadA, partial [Planctomycetes bacterium]|nr:Flp pilus assembly complex ATPase component TadA [Planctomycetota bacterium]